MSDLESVVEESKPKDPSANPKPQSSELFDEVFLLFKGYLNTKLEAQAKLIEGQSKIQTSTSEFKFKGKRKQFEVNAKLESPELRLELTTQVRCLTLAQEAQQINRKRQKLINIADRSKDSWLIVQEYESDDLASNSEDEKRLKKAEIYFLFYYYRYLPHNNYKKYRKRRKKEVARRPNRNYRSLLEVRPPQTMG